MIALAPSQGFWFQRFTANRGLIVFAFRWSQTCPHQCSNGIRNIVIVVIILIILIITTAITITIIIIIVVVAYNWVRAER